MKITFLSDSSNTKRLWRIKKNLLNKTWVNPIDAFFTEKKTTEKKCFFNNSHLATLSTLYKLNRKIKIGIHSSTQWYIQKNEDSLLKLIYTKIFNRAARASSLHQCNVIVKHYFHVEANTSISKVKRIVNFWKNFFSLVMPVFVFVVLF